MRHYLFAIVLALAGASPAAATWREAKTNHFVIYSEQDAKKLEDFATRLERYDAAMRYVRKVPDIVPGPANRLTIYVVPRAATVQRLMGDNSKDVAGFYIGRASGSIAIIPRIVGSGSEWDMDAENVLLHEYAHHFLYQNFSGAYPAWFIEGFAEFHSTAKYEDDGSVGIGLPAKHRAYGLMSGNPLPAEKMMTSTVWSLNALQREALYGRGWLLTHYLTFNATRTPQFAKYLRLINEGHASLEAATTAFGDLKILDRELSAYARRREMNYLPVPPRPTGPVAMRELGSGEAAVMNAKIRSRRGVDREQAKTLLTEMRRLAAPFPNDPAVLATLAEAEYDAGYYQEAEAAADRAIALDPKSMDGLIYKAMANMALAEKSDDPKVWQKVRRLIAAANRMDPSHATPLILFYESFHRQGIAPTANAVLGLNSAYELAPHDTNLRLQVARQYLVDGHAKEARTALAPIAFDPHGGDASQFVSTIIAKIDAGGASAALDAWNRVSEEAEKAGVEEGKKEGDEKGDRVFSLQPDAARPFASLSSSAALRSRP